jgi:hypothetical protein
MKLYLVTGAPSGTDMVISANDCAEAAKLWREEWAGDYDKVFVLPSSPAEEAGVHPWEEGEIPAANLCDCIIQRLLEVRGAIASIEQRYDRAPEGADITDRHRSELADLGRELVRVVYGAVCAASIDWCGPAR